MVKHRQYFAFFLLLLATSCAPSMTTQERSALEQEANRSVTCQAGADCEQKWGRVEQWIKNNSTYKIVKHSNTVIETSGPSGLEDLLGFSATKRKTDNDAYDIVLDIRCNDWFTCTHPRLDARAHFVNFVMGPPPPPKPPFGIKATPVGPDIALTAGVTRVNNGVIVTSIISNSPADKIGLQIDDVITEYDGIPIFSESLLLSMISKAAPNGHANLVIVRNGQKLTLPLNA